jgi:hypothetical protein
MEFLVLVTPPLRKIFSAITATPPRSSGGSRQAERGTEEGVGLDEFLDFARVYHIWPAHLSSDQCLAVFVDATASSTSPKDASEENGPRLSCAEFVGGRDSHRCTQYQ